jgi:hypothetical protein
MSHFLHNVAGKPSSRFVLSPVIELKHRLGSAMEEI